MTEKKKRKEKKKAQLNSLVREFVIYRGRVITGSEMHVIYM